MSNSLQPSKPGLIAFAGGNADFRAARARCAAACKAYNETPGSAPAQVRVAKFLEIISPGSEVTGNVTTAEHMYSANAVPRPFVPFVKTPIRMDYGLRVKIAATTIINHGCSILDTPVADVTIGEHCLFGPNVTIASVGHPVGAEHRLPTTANGQTRPLTSYGVAVTVDNNVWIGTGAIVLGGVTIGDRCVIGGGSVVTRDIPADSFAAGDPAKVIRAIANEPLPTYVGVAWSLKDALNNNFSDNKPVSVVSDDA